MTGYEQSPELGWHVEVCLAPVALIGATIYALIH